MQNKLFFFLLLVLISCGKDVKFTNQLETNNSIIEAQPIAISQSAIIVRSTSAPPGRIIINGKTYNISPFSSYLALKFVGEQPENVQVTVKISAEVKSSEVYIKVIEL